MHTRYPTWGLTAALLLFATAAAIAAPRLGDPAVPQQSPAASEDHVAEDLCVSIGKWECCYKDPDS